jgi:hypothetical protein
MTAKSRLIASFVVVCIAGLIAVAVWPDGNAAEPPQPGQREGATAGRTPFQPASPSRGGAASGASRDEGGREAGSGPTALDSAQEGTDAAPQSDTNPSDQVENDPFDYGQTPPVEPDANPQVAAVFAAIQNREADPESYAKAVSPLAKADAFDREKYVEDRAYRDAYLSTPQPSRVFDPAQPGKDVPRLCRISPAFQKVKQGQETKLRVRAIPGAPVTFTSFDLGRFDNQLTTITVQADANGVAEASFTGPPGTIEDVSILVASPVTSGQVRLVVHVTRS